MGKISILPDVVCNQIAAGEVIERPAAVVKELLENSIDAGSLRIGVSLQQGGRREIRVVDNGSGMGRDDALLALERHATSKITSMEDLQSVQSLGFRGEALPSIASVSRFEMVTRTEGEVSGTLIRMEGGILRDVQDKGSPVGTVITVRDLFYNLPARRKFLRTIDTEMGHINDQFLRLSLAHHGIHFQLAHEGRVLSQYPAAGDSLQRAGQVLGLELMKKLRPFCLETSTMRLHGHLSSPDVQRTSGQAIFLFMNGRPVWDRLVSRSILSAYESLLPKGKFPVVLLHMEILPSLVDVNVHPTKREVRFRGPGEVMETIRLALREALKGNAPISSFPESPGGRPAGAGSLPHGARAEETAGSVFPARETSSSVPFPRMPHQLPVSAFRAPARSAAPQMLREQTCELSPAACDSQEKSDATRLSGLRILGQVAQAYIVLESFTGMVIVDQHAAHERIIYDRLCAEPSLEPSQRLLRSAIVELLPRQAALLRKWLGELKSFGFDIEPFGGDAFTVHSVPAFANRCAPEALIRDLLEQGCEEENRPHWDLRLQIARTTACHKAVKAGLRMSHEEIRHLLRDLDGTAFPSTCPHGRPLWFEVTGEDMAQRFQRK